MTEAKQGAPPTEQPKKSLKERWIGLIDPVKRYFHEQGAKRAQEGPEIKAARSTARATVVIAVFTVALAAIGWLQWKEVEDSTYTLDRMNRIYRAQSSQLSRQANETTQLAQETKILAEGMRSLATSTRQQLVGTQAAVLRPSVYMNIGENDVDAHLSGGNSGHINARDFEATEWITVRRLPDNRVVAGPFHHKVEMHVVPYGTIESLEDHYYLPIDQGLMDSLKKADTYVAVEWNAHYNDGFGNIIYSSEKGALLCQASAEVGSLDCPQHTGRYRTPEVLCNQIASAVSATRRDMEEEREKYCPGAK
jgi:hypothetical protein